MNHETNHMNHETNHMILKANHMIQNACSLTRRCDQVAITENALDGKFFANFARVLSYLAI
jgi:hypothetical protein